MRLNKIIVGASAFAMAAALSAGVGSADASAANTVEKSVSDKISIDYTKQTLKLAGLDDTKISVAFPTVKDKKVGADKNLCTYDVDSKKEVNVDLSTLNVTKDNYIKVCGNKNTTPVIVKIPAATQLGKGTVKDDKITVVDKAKAEVKVALDYAIGNGNFETKAATDNKVTEIDVANYTQLGATVRVRTSASATAENDTIIAKAPVEYTVGKSTTDKVNVYELTGTFAGKEIKVKVAKLANAPKVKVDWTKGTVTLPKNAEYRVNTIGQSAALGKDATGWTAVDKLVLKKATKDSLTATEMKSGEVLDFAKGGDIDVRTKATEKKPASKYLSFVYDKKAPVYVVSATDTQGASGVADTKYDSVEVKFGNTAKNTDSDKLYKLEFKYARTQGTKVGKKEVATSGAITVKNTDDKYTYQYVVVNSNTAPAVDVKGIKSVKAKTGTATIKLNNKNDQYVFVRRAAVTKGDVAWATEWVKAIALTKTDLVPTVEVAK